MTLTNRQNEIIDTALRLTAEGGIQELTIKNIAGQLGITEPAIYRHFRNKSEIVKAMIRKFDEGVSPETDRKGLEGIDTFIRSRIRQVMDNPSLARVMFAEELFLDDPEYSELLLNLMHWHRSKLHQFFQEAQEFGEIRRDIDADLLFRLVFGPVRLLIKQWGMSNQAFDLQAEGEELLSALRKILR